MMRPTAGGVFPRIGQIKARSPLSGPLRGVCRRELRVRPAGRGFRRREMRKRQIRQPGERLPDSCTAFFADVGAVSVPTVVYRPTAGRQPCSRHDGLQVRRSGSGRRPLPADGLPEDVAVGGVLGREGAAAVLDAEHHQRLPAGVADRTASGRRHADHAPFADGEALAVDLEFALPAQEEVELLVGAVGVQEAGLGAGGKALERKLGARRADGGSAEDLAGKLCVGSQRQPVFAQSGHLARIDGGEVFARRNLFHLFHVRIVFLRFAQCRFPVDAVALCNGPNGGAVCANDPEYGGKVMCLFVVCQEITFR